MPILKKMERDRGFTQIPNDLLRSGDLSLAAKGLLCYMLSCSEDWKFSIKGLSTVLGETEYKIQKLLTELEEKGYHKKEAIREDGKIIEWKYFISDTPTVSKQERVKLEVPEQKPKKKNLFQQCVDVVDEEFIDPEVKDKLKVYLDIRIRYGRLSVKSWRSIILELRDLAKTREDALEIIKNATAKGYMKLYPVNNYKKKNTFVDDIHPVVTNDKEGLLRQKYIEEFSSVPKCDRPSFEDWSKTQ